MGQAGVEPAIPEGGSFTDSWICRFPTDPYVRLNPHLQKDFFWSFPTLLNPL